MNKIIKIMRNNMYKQVEDAIGDGETVQMSVMSIYLQFKLLEKLDTIDKRLACIENEISKLNSKNE